MNVHRWMWMSVLAALLGAVVLPAAAELSDKKMEKLIGKLPEEDRQQIAALKIFMQPDEVEAYLTLTDHESRETFLDETGYLRKWRMIQEEMLPHVIARDVVKGMTKDELWMSWGKPVQVRQSFYQKAYVDIYTYFFFRDRKGNDIPTPDRDDPRSYNRPQWEMNVYFHNDHVVSVLEEGQMFNPKDLTDSAAPMPEALDTTPDDETDAVEEEEAEEGEPEVEEVEAE